MPETKTGSVLSNSTYDRLKFFALVVLPALGALYFGLAPYWELPKAEEVVGSLVVIDTFLGLLLARSNVKYNKVKDGPLIGFLDVHDEGRDVPLYNVKTPFLDPHDIVHEDRVTFKVRRNPKEEPDEVAL